MSFIPKYQFHVKTWGGFYNDEHKAIHGLDEGDFFFNSEKDRKLFMENRRKISKELNAHVLCFDCSEGFACDARTVLHRVSEYNGKQYYSTRDMGVNYPFDDAKEFMNSKWYLGFNDYPLGEDFDDYDDVNVVQEWITGSFTTYMDDF